MPSRSSHQPWIWVVGLGLLFLASPTRTGFGQTPRAPLDARPEAIPREGVGSIKPTPMVGLPDDPPPHEGALIDIPLVIEPPDIIIVEVLMALPGRPITGERLVRPDGTISLGFYGDVHVRGLTLPQAKAKIVHHLRRYLDDNALGLRLPHEVIAEVEPLPRPGTKVRVPAPAVPEEEPMGKRGVEAPDAPKPDKPIEPAPVPPAELNASRPSRATRASRRTRLGRRAVRITAKTQDGKPPAQDEPKPVEPAKPEAKVEVAPDEVELTYIDPADTYRVFVDIVSFNSTVYFVQGDVGTPGRLPFTGKETVLDALNYAGGLVPTAEPSDIHLHRPARGDKPVKDYSIDFAAIQKGDAKANLQVFPNDRLVVGRNPIVKKTMDMDRAAAPINAVLNSALQYSFTARSLGAAFNDINGTNQAQRDEALKRWVEFLWTFSSTGGDSLQNESALRESLLRKLDPPSEDKKATPAPR